MLFLLVILGGFFGAICRYMVGEWVSTGDGFPIGTLAVNLIGCFLLGWLLTYVRRWNRMKTEVIQLIGTGFIGSFTTFSTFSVETLNLLQDEKFIIALLYIVASVFVGLLFTCLGYKLAKLGNQGEGETA
ncbi:fluoride efflux transporter CrcB [Alkalihalobacillus sp. AL-G]|uniref:fluoride efflux transporter CrcB n=1 Tax=Alkalihalobacillus sp. AL-G TaxID=2926399 RepID=UPI00272B76C2|nr:fluoride efflux transporter CrcB [Alkalihalobacillus sp. AL-G]WLD92779.1 fluoride efflux transporter CrcB [Alkalihalobacillus sp. AL-G]